uniref:Uncharacterized protein n=1 Tax=Setaria digitata TaxID=48799 RepID=A0A915PWT2_9BILA
MPGSDVREGHVGVLLSRLRILLGIEQPSQVCDSIIKEIESFDKEQLLTSSVDSLAARVDLPSVDIWHCFNSLIQLRDIVHNNKLRVSDLKDILSRDSFSDEVIKIIINYVNTEQPHKLITANAVSKYPPFRSLHCRLQITVTCMLLLVMALVNN